MYEFMTRLVHLGRKKFNFVTPPEVVPIYMSSVFSFDGIDQLDEVYSDDASGYVYSRISSPIQDSLNEIISQIDEGQDAQVYATGMAAIAMTIISLVKTGDHIISSKYLYGGTREFLKNHLSKFGVDITFLDFDKDDIRSHFRQNTKVVFLETITSVSYPIKTSHRSLSEAELAKSNISSGLLRISTGLENADDIIEEFDTALRLLEN
ncbi:MAG: PLP-dependent transferase [Tepidanaerobacteraceae bacterium]|jgi:methionine-gamma-lyase